MVRDTGEEPEVIRICVKTAMEAVKNQDQFEFENALDPLPCTRVPALMIGIRLPRDVVEFPLQLFFHTPDTITSHEKRNAKHKHGVRNQK